MTALSVVARIRGGLGNQLFMYAMARRLAAVNRATLVIDGVSGFSGHNKYGRVYMLDRFPIEGRPAMAAERREPMASLRRRLVKAADACRPLQKRRFLLDPGHFDADIHALELRRSVTVEGYWQSERWFDDMRDEIRTELTPDVTLTGANTDTARAMAESDSVALHVRFFQDAAATRANQAVSGYYHRALKQMREQRPKAQYFLFSDRPGSAMDVLSLSPDEVQIVDQNQGDARAHLDLYLMSRCRHFITANSTFSWWGAWLGESPDSVVVCPKFSAEQGFLAWGMPGLLPARWECIEG